MEADADVNPMEKVSPPKVPQEVLEPLSLKTLGAMLRTCKPKTFEGDRDRAILLALLDTGCRAREFLAVDLEHVNLSTGAVVVKHGKGSKRRVTFLGTKARKAMIRYLRHIPETGALWRTRTGTRLRYSGLRAIVRRRAASAGVLAPPLHSFRRAFALLSLRSGSDLLSLQRMLGHSDLTMLRRYIKQTEDDLRATHEKHGPVDNWL